MKKQMVSLQNRSMSRLMWKTEEGIQIKINKNHSMKQLAIDNYERVSR